jgi:Sodium/hydrogen exchanger family
LPPIIFYAGLSVKKKKFFRNFASIATLGILGTYILFAVIALGLFAISKLPNLLNLTVRCPQPCLTCVLTPPLVAIPSGPLCKCT